VARQTNSRVLDLVVADTGSAQAILRDSPSLFGQFRWQTASNLGAAALGAVYLVYLGRELGAGNFGLFALATGVATFAFSATDLRSQESMVRYLAVFAGRPDERAACVRFLLLVDASSRVIVWLLLLAVSPLVTKFLIKSHDALATIVLAATAAMLAKIGNGPAVGVLRAFRRFDWHATNLLSTWIAKLSVTWLALQIVGTSVLVVLSAALVCDLAGNLAIIWRAARELARSQIVILGTSSRRVSRRVEIGKFLAASAGMSVSDSFVRELDTTIVAWYLPLPDVGVYRMAKNIVLMVWRAVDPVYIVLMPEFARQLADGRGGETARLAARTTIFVFAASLIVLTAMFFVLPTVLLTVLGASFRAAPEAADLMAIGLLCGAPLIWTHALSVGAGKVHIQLCANLLGAVLAGTTFVLLTPRFGLNGAAVGFAVALGAPFVISALIWTPRIVRLAR
jgi:O-antigen/teichoic acid export membrane protein